MNEWKEVKLGDLVTIKYGKDHKSLSDGVFPVFGSGGLMRKVDTYIYDKPSLLIPRKGTLNNIIYTEERFWTVDTMFWTKVDELQTSAKFLYYYLKDFNFNALNVGSAVPSLTVPVLNDIDIKLPSTDKQSGIVGILSSLDAKIETNNKLNEKLEEMAQAIFKSWFVDFEPFKDKPFHETELGMIPEGWEIYTIDEFCRVFTGKKNTNQAEKNGKYPFFSCAPDPLNSNDYLYDGYAIIIAGNGSYTGRTQLYNGKFDLYQRTYACVAKERSFDKKIVFFYLMMKQTFEREKMGGTRGSSIPYIVMNDIAKHFFCYNESVVTKFCNIVRPILDMKHKLQYESKHLASLRDTLLPRLMSGELKV